MEDTVSLQTKRAAGAAVCLVKKVVLGKQKCLDVRISTPTRTRKEPGLLLGVLVQPEEY